MTGEANPLPLSHCSTSALPVNSQVSPTCDPNCQLRQQMLESVTRAGEQRACSGLVMTTSLQHGKLCETSEPVPCQLPLPPAPSGERSTFG